jgi:hypothetical protein
MPFPATTVPAQETATDDFDIDAALELERAAVAEAEAEAAFAEAKPAVRGQKRVRDDFTDLSYKLVKLLRHGHREFQIDRTSDGYFVVADCAARLDAPAEALYEAILRNQFHGDGQARYLLVGDGPETAFVKASDSRRSGGAVASGSTDSAVAGGGDNKRAKKVWNTNDWFCPSPSCRNNKTGCFAKHRFCPVCGTTRPVDVA